MPIDLRRLATELVAAGDVSPDAAIEIVATYFASNDEAPNSLRSIIARSIFAELAADYVLIPRSNVPPEGMRVINKVSGQVGQASLRHRQRFVVVSEGDDQVGGRSNLDLTVGSQGFISDYALGDQPPSAHSAGLVEGRSFGERASRSVTSREMRRFTKLARGGHLVPKGSIIAEASSDMYSSVYDTVPAPSWGPKGWFAGVDKSRGVAGNSKRSSTPSNVSRSQTPQGLTPLGNARGTQPLGEGWNGRPKGSFSDYVRSNTPAVPNDSHSM